MGRDLLHALRALRRSPGFTAASAICLALGIGSTVAMFTVVQAVLLRPLPFAQPERIVGLWNHLTKMDLAWLGTSDPEYLEYVERSTVFREIAASFPGSPATLLGEGGPEMVMAGFATPSLFPLLGVRAALGRTFTAEEGIRGKAMVVLLSDGLWRRRFGADPSIVGRSVEVSGEPLAVVGVLPAGFRYGPAGASSPDLWLVLTFDPANLRPRRLRYLDVVGRLADGLSLARAQAGIESLARQVEAENPEVYRPQGRKVVLVPLQERLVAEARSPLLMLLGAVVLVLLIACVNFANLLLIRATRRSGEMALRVALGADRLHLLRYVVLESSLPAWIGGALGLLAAGSALRLLVAIYPGAVPRAEEIHVGAAAAAFAGALSVLVGLALGLVPAPRLFRRRLQPLLKEGGSTLQVGRRSLRNALVVCEIALAFVLLIGAGLLIESFERTRKVAPGFRPRGLLTLRLALPAVAYKDDARTVGFYQALVERVQALPSVGDVGLISNLPLSGVESETAFLIEGRQRAPDEGAPTGDQRVVTPGYHRTLGITLKEGRFFAPSDGPGAPLVALVDDTVARREWPREDPIGRRIKLGSSGEGPWLTIVGVVGHIKQTGLDRDARGQLYTVHAQRPTRNMTLVVRAGGDPLALLPAIRGVIAGLDGKLAVAQVRIMEEVIAESLAARRFSTTLLTVFALIAVALAVVGVYGVVAYSVTLRSREIGLRVAMGARATDLRQLVVGQGVALALIGLAIGGAGAAALTRFLRSLLFGIGAHDPVTFTVVGAALLASCALASYLPARRALRFDPAAVLRAE